MRTFAFLSILMLLSVASQANSDTKFGGPFGLPQDDEIAEFLGRPWGNCQYSKATEPEVIHSKFTKGCELPQEICVAKIECKSEGKINRISTYCLARDGKCPKRAIACVIAGQILVNSRGSKAVSELNDYFDYQRKQSTSAPKFEEAPTVR